MIPVHPQFHSKSQGGLYWWLNFDLDLQVFQFILTFPHNTPTQKIKVLSICQNQQQKAN